MKETPIILQYKKIKAEHPDCLLFFRLGDFYELFFEDAKIASKALDIVLTARGKADKDSIPMCGVPAHASESYIARLVKQGFHIAICEQMEAPHEALKGPIRREVVRIVTPGTLVEENLLEARSFHFLTAIVDEPQEKHVGIAFLDVSTGDFFIERQPYQHVLSALERMRPKEILMADFLIEKEPFATCWKTWKTKITLLPASRFDVCACEKRLETFFNVKTLQVFGLFSNSEAAAGGALVDYVLLTQKRHVMNLSRPKKLDRGDFVLMDAFTRRSLELLTTLSGEKEGSLLYNMDYTVTAIGARLLFLHLTHPLKNLKVLQRRLDNVSFFAQNIDHRRILRELLKGLPDIERALSRLLLGRQNPRDLGAIRSALILFPKIHSLCEKKDLPEDLSKAFGSLLGYERLAKMLCDALEEVLPLTLRDGGVIASGFSASLDEIRSLKANAEEILEALRKKYIEESQIQSLKIRYNNMIGYYIEIPSAAAPKVPFHFILRQSLASAMRYTTSELHELEQRLSEAREEVLQKEVMLFEECVDMLRSFSESLKVTIRSLALLDVASSLAELADQNHYVRPVLDDSLAFHIEGGRHPVVEKRITDVSFVKNDCHMQQTLWIVTGPNMAGKSTFLRQNVLIAIMAHMGSFVPADKAYIGLMDRIFSRVGASDDIASGYSTFMVEMVETAAILNQATQRSFVILDEIGRGTSTHDGLSLAWACIEHLLDVLKCRTLFSTHYHELAALKTRPDIGFYTLGIKEWNNMLVFLYNIIEGAADRSYGLHIARLAGLPESVLARAETLLGALSEDPLKEPFQEESKPNLVKSA